MLEVVRQLISNQFDASLCMLNECIVRCPEDWWNQPVGNHPFCRVAFHTLFFTDFYLGEGDGDELNRQAFHRDHPDFFRNYEELEDREPAFLYDRPRVQLYLEHCREKAKRVVENETQQTLSGNSGFERRDCTRAELHVYSMRHIQHHVAQLSLRLRRSCSIAIPWVAHAWKKE